MHVMVTKEIIRRRGSAFTAIRHIIIVIAVYCSALYNIIIHNMQSVPEGHNICNFSVNLSNRLDTLYIIVYILM